MKRWANGVRTRGLALGATCLALVLLCTQCAKKEEPPELRVRIEAEPQGYVVTRERKSIRVSNVEALAEALAFDEERKRPKVVIEIRDDQGFLAVIDALSSVAASGYFPWNLKNLDHPLDEFEYRGTDTSCCHNHFSECERLAHDLRESGVYRGADATLLYLDFYRNSEWVSNGQIIWTELESWLAPQLAGSKVRVYCDLRSDNQVREWWPAMILVQAKGFSFVMDEGEDETDFPPGIRLPMRHAWQNVTFYRCPTPCYIRGPYGGPLISGEAWGL